MNIENIILSTQNRKLGKINARRFETIKTEPKRYTENDEQSNL